MRKNKTLRSEEEDGGGRGGRERREWGEREIE